MKNQEKLNKTCPALNGAKMGDLLVAIILLVNDLKSAMASMKTTYDKLLAQANNRCFTSAGAAMSAGTKDRIKTANSISYAINGNLYTEAAADPVGAWTAGHTGLGNSEEAYYLLCVDDAGDFSTVEGDIVAAGDGCVPPALPADVAPVALVKIVTTGSGTFTPDTTNLDDAGLDSVTFTDLSVLTGSSDAPAAAPSLTQNAINSLD